ncbi:divalent-cation tolerance protein CutA [Coraliomargarita akajimensis]|uniref:CutA1 divalent ion tolerance protein n=1 Tax=Coraliomargarita akajimensis (strain DSM 45221 / IAM 15411 / JCM 23193 / KCTC 12865 / 04OKA010-24) TaxID=583355 RepID=D5EJL9_CORAD|nr:divalent-cation tolerance protein CutA [Coraliomargarita akajimensis]ADE54618.1 CutA1 divalent ion tolerance protein [Coraliomargarita akajimensis DSM 45221]
MSTGLCIGWTTIGSESAACELARELIACGLVACVQLEGPVRSMYKWDGRLCDEVEWRLMLKFAEAQSEAVEAKILHLHPYVTPEWVVVRADQVSLQYLNWVLGE